MVIRLDPAEDPWPEKIESTTAIEKMFFFHLWDFKVVPKRFLQIRFCFYALVGGDRSSIEHRETPVRCASIS